jgi:hypothetical protein
MLDQDFNQQHYAYDEMGLEFDGVDYEHGDDVISRLLGELGQYGRERASDLFPKLVSIVARDHLQYGICIFELSEQAGAEAPGPRLGLLPGWSLKHRGRRTFQATPSGGKLEWRKLPTSALIRFRLPERLGRELHRVGERLRALDTRKRSDLDMIANLRSTGYDFRTHQILLDEMAARATRSIGWDGRGAFLRRATDSYRTYRRLRFLRTWLTVASATTETLNVICRHPGVNAGAPITIRVTGLPTIDEVDQHMDAVIDGTESLDKISKQVLHPRHN